MIIPRQEDCGLDGSTFTEESDIKDWCGLRNNRADYPHARLGQLHPQCVACHDLGYCREGCPTKRSDFVCTVFMSPRAQEAGWRGSIFNGWRRCIGRLLRATIETCYTVRSRLYCKIKDCLL